MSVQQKCQKSIASATVSLHPAWLFVLYLTLTSFVIFALQPPLLVHCSAGVGRTGTFIGTYTVLSSLQDIRKDKFEISIPGLVRDMRKQRVCMVQRLAQYEFLYTSALIATDEVSSILSSPSCCLTP